MTVSIAPELKERLQDLKERLLAIRDHL